MQPCEDRKRERDRDDRELKSFKISRPLDKSSRARKAITQEASVEIVSDEDQG